MKRKKSRKRKNAIMGFNTQANTRWSESAVGQVRSGFTAIVIRSALDFPKRTFKIASLQFEISCATGTALIQLKSFYHNKENPTKESSVYMVTNSKIRGNFNINSDWYPEDTPPDQKLFEIVNKCLKSGDDHTSIFLFRINLIIQPSDLDPACPKVQYAELKNS